MATTTSEDPSVGGLQFASTGPNNNTQMTAAIASAAIPAHVHPSIASRTPSTAALPATEVRAAGVLTSARTRSRKRHARSGMIAASASHVRPAITSRIRDSVSEPSSDSATDTIPVPITSAPAAGGVQSSRRTKAPGFARSARVILPSTQRIPRRTRRCRRDLSARALILNLELRVELTWGETVEESISGVFVENHADVPRVEYAGARAPGPRSASILRGFTRSAQGVRASIGSCKTNGGTAFSPTLITFLSSLHPRSRASTTLCRGDSLLTQAP